jgi:PD-(D/E)XK endonuclease
VLTTDQKGAIAETAVAHAAVKHGVGVYAPVAAGSRYDLIFDVGGRLLRVQCKWANRADDVVLVRCYSSRRTRNGMFVRRYTAAEIDLIAAYCLELDRCYLLPPQLFERRRLVHLRLAPSRNKQSAGINWAAVFEIAVTLDRLGAVAQLGERRAGSAKATGSSPVGSMTKAVRQN